MRSSVPPSVRPLIWLVLLLVPCAALAATTPASGTLSPANPVLTYTGGPFLVSNPSTSTSDNPPGCPPGTDAACSEFTLTVSIPDSDFNSYKARVSIAWINSGSTTQGSASSDFDTWVYSPDLVTGTQSGVSASGNNPEVVSFDAPPGTYTVYVLPYDVSPSVTFTATASLYRAGSPWPSDTSQTSVPAGTPRFFNYPAPPGWGEDAGEPSVGVNWKTDREAAAGSGVFNGGTVNYFGGFLPYMLSVTFDDRFVPAKPAWRQSDLVMANLPRVFGDPILFTDSVMGRTFVTQEMGLTPLGSTMEFTDTDSAPFTPSEGSGAPSGVDHETVGGGPFHAPIPTGVDPNYGHGVWYCSQSIADAVCSISLDGGMTFGPAVPMYTLAQCGGLHGHVKIGPDGTAFVPNKDCGTQALLVSEDNGISWNIRSLPDSTTNDRDPSVAIGRDGTVYFAYQDGSGASKVAVSRDNGMTWSPSTDIGASVGVKNSLFHAAVAGDGDRAAIAFFGTQAGGSDWNTPDFSGVWHLYVATTFDRGATWITQNVTPGDPIQRGGICDGGACRNLLDFFDASIDKRGRVVVGYDDGCISDNCIAGVRSYGIRAPNDYTAKAVIARQASGLRMFHEYDGEAGPDVNPTPPPPPPPTATSCDGNVVSDPAGDAQHPLIDNSGVDSSMVDITGLRFAVNAAKTSLVTTIVLSNFTPQPLAGSLGTFYYAVWTAAQKNSDGTIASRYYATRASVSATGSVTYTFGQYDAADDSFLGTTTTVTGTYTTGPEGTISVNVPLALLGNPTIPVTDPTTLPAVIEPYALTIISEQAVRFTTPADRAPNVGSFGANWAVCPAPAVTCLEDDDATISYSDGWHQVASASASGGHFRLHLGNSSSHSASVTFNVSGGNTGKVTYDYATSPKGGSADVWIDGASRGVISYGGTDGSTRDPKFGARVSYDGLVAGSHTFELRNMSGAVYVDRFCLESSASTGNPSSGPGATSASSTSIAAAQESLTQLTVPSNAQEISIAAEASPNVPIRIALVSPAGLTLATADNSSGFATLDVPVTQGGTYVVKVINLSVGSVYVWTVATPRVSR